MIDKTNDRTELERRLELAETMVRYWTGVVSGVRAEIDNLCGWVAWEGQTGQQPDGVDPFDVVEFINRGGEKHAGYAKELNWKHAHWAGDIVLYRIVPEPDYWTNWFGMSGDYPLDVEPDSFVIVQCRDGSIDRGRGDSFDWADNVDSPLDIDKYKVVVVSSGV